MSALLDLMRKLGSDAALAAEYGKDPEGVVKRAGLSEDEARAMLRKDYPAIKKLTGLSQVVVKQIEQFKRQDYSSAVDVSGIEADIGDGAGPGDLIEVLEPPTARD